MNQNNLEEMLNRFYLSDERFLLDAYSKMLGREPDKEGFGHYIRELRSGTTKTEILKNIVQSEEFLRKFVTTSPKNLPGLILLKKENYLIENGIDIFEIKKEEDFDWLEMKILENGYYERHGVWAYEINLDSMTIAEIMSFFRPTLALEIGCSFGSIMQCLHNMGIHCEGVELSKFAKERSFSNIKKYIHLGDLLNIDLKVNYDLIYALDLFEHLNPNKLKRYLLKIYDLLSNDGYIFVNIPVFGDDSIFGTVFQLYIEDWKSDFIDAKLFSKLPVDDRGYPINGHLIWAGSNWWINQFIQIGFQRETEIEKAIHAKYDIFMEEYRKTFYVFSKNKNFTKAESIISSIYDSKSFAQKVLK